MSDFLLKRIKSVGYAFKGAFILLTTEASIKVQFFLAVIATIAGFWFNLSSVEWTIQLLTIGLVISIEGLNTAVEKIADFIHPDFNDKIGSIKDIAAGAVFISATIAVIVGCIIYLPKIF